MNHETNNQIVEPATSAESVAKTPHPVNQVTPLSKYLAMVIFIALPFVGGYIGYQLAPERVIEIPVSQTLVPTQENIQPSNSVLEQAIDPYKEVVIPEIEEGSDYYHYSEQARSQYIKLASGERIAHFYVRDNNVISYSSSTVTSQPGETETYTTIYVPITGADASTFEVSVVSAAYARDTKHVYLNGEIIPTADPLTFVPLCVFWPGTNGECAYSKDVNHVYWEKSVVQSADPKTIVYLEGGKDYPSFAADSSSVYRGSESVKALTDEQLLRLTDTSKIKVDPTGTNWADYHDGLTIGDAIYIEWLNMTDGNVAYSVYSKSIKGSDKDTLYVSKVDKAGDRPKVLK